MLCMDLWRLREYPVDKLLFKAEKRASKGFRWNDLSPCRFEGIKKFYKVKKCIKNLYGPLSGLHQGDRIHEL